MLWTGQIAEKVRAYLEPGGVFEVFQATFDLYEGYLEEIAEKLVLLLDHPKYVWYSAGTVFTPTDRSMQADKRDLKALIEANKPKNGHNHFSQSLAFVMSEASLEELLRNLSDSALSLKDFIDDIEDLFQIQRSNKEPRGAKQKKIANSLHMIRKHANALFRAVLCGWSQGSHDRHDAMLCLEHRCQENRFTMKATPQGGVNGIIFTLLFSWQATSNTISMYVTSVMTVEEDSSMLLCGDR